MLGDRTKEEDFIHILEENLYLMNEYKIQLILDYLREFEKFLQIKAAELRKKIDAWEFSSIEKGDSNIVYFIDDQENFERHFKQFKIESTFLSSYSLFEHYFKSFTELFKDYFDVRLNIDDLSGNNYINKSKRYLEKVCLIDLTSSNDTWNKITSYQKIRNRIVHHNGYFLSNDKNIVDQIAQIEGIEVNRFNKIEFTDKVFVTEFWNTFNIYMKGIIVQTKSKILKSRQ